ncbi:unnamed protein product [Penicillium salamii]|uniref:Uncharacterized protein n=1 Tax=Penicillium salamii TaxID=1612424 RepID=A0A9W4ICC9_9EURO|nr:unnamed protein product [Penicillium salamii]CAG8033836.1 unnamed protein product [Penicillium salamii]CAG8086914.1 unnamed protein product [Penicillium salamii]CAG8167566.1 unnamed protein product [Penicillium salamii]CAG8203251.1 unnamed protein product [Penicillium salamii]
MAPTKMPLQADEEMGKKDDDHRPIDARFRSLRHKAIPRPRRIVIALIILIILYEFFKNMPTDLAPAVERYDPGMAKLRAETLAKWTGPEQVSTSTKPDGLPLVPAPVWEQKGKGYEGEVMFPELEHSLPRYKYSSKTSSRAVLFAASSLRSMSDMLPLACHMANQPLSYVHFILMGKDEISVPDIKAVNGIKENECPIKWHVGRPDAAPMSTDARMNRSVRDGLQILWAYIRPEVIISQGKSWEDSFFWEGVEAHCRDSRTPHIALPAASKDLMWMAYLDSAALQSWNKVRIEMVINAPTFSGSLIRLVKSLDAADYLGSVPRLTIELPPVVDPQLLEFLRRPEGLSQLADRITLRRRIQPHRMDPAEASLRTLESFYPLEPEMTHLLMLSPQAELAPSFYHYLKYSVLNYKHSARAKHIFPKLVGVSLELPSTKPTVDREIFAPPEMVAKDKEHVVPSFIWQAPNSNAALYFGDLWTEFHSFLSNRLSTPESAPVSHTKLISEQYPAFMEYLLELIRAKGYYLLYPSFPGKEYHSIATIHEELYQPPEEFGDRIASSPDNEGDSATASGSVEKSPSHITTIMPLFDLFPSGLPDLDALSLLGFDGERLNAVDYEARTREYLQSFRTDYGGCVGDSKMDTPSPDLFCQQK